MRTRQDLKNGKDSASDPERPIAEKTAWKRREMGHIGDRTKTDHRGRSRGLNKYLLNECVNESDRQQQHFQDR